MTTLLWRWSDQTKTPQHPISELRNTAPGYMGLRGTILSSCASMATPWIISDCTAD